MLMIPKLESKLDKIAIWRGATTAYTRTGQTICNCDFCGIMSFGYFMRVFHTIDKEPKFQKFITKTTYLLTDHIYLCQSCSESLDSKWISCNCKKNLINKDKEVICQVQKSR